MSAAYTFSERVVVEPDVLSRVVGDETVILNLKTERYLGLNDTATRMWTVLGAARTIQEAYEALLAEFEVGPEELKDDLHALIDAMLEHRLIAIVPAE